MKRLGDGRFYLVREDVLDRFDAKNDGSETAYFPLGKHQPFKMQFNKWAYRVAHFINIVILCFLLSPLHANGF